jgi:hypothetical protein
VRTRQSNLRGGNLPPTWTRRTATLTVIALAVGLAGQPAAISAPARWAPPKPADVAGVPAHNLRPRPAATVKRAPTRPVRATWPKAGAATVDLTATGTGTSVAAAGLPVRLGRPPARTDVAESGRPLAPSALRATVTVFDHSAAVSAGVNGILFDIGRADSGTTATTVNVAVDYSGFAGAFGGDWASRLRLVELPRCALSTPNRPECRVATPLGSINQVAAQAVSGQIPVSATQPALLAATAGAAGDNGDYTATSLSSAGTWKVSAQTGDFSWSDTLRTPPALGGPGPTLSLSYSSGSVDGRTGTSNNQGGWVGDGWDSWPGFIERHYASCADDNPTHQTGDQCWFSDNATLSLNGHAGELIQNGNVWHLKNDDGTRVVRLTDSGRGNGDNDNEYWQVTTTDGTQYFFGYHKLPGWVAGNQVTDSTWTVPVYGNNPGEPCHNTTFATSWCQQAWRWNLDYVVDPHQNTMAYFYGKVRFPLGTGHPETRQWSGEGCPGVPSIEVPGAVPP